MIAIVCGQLGEQSIADLIREAAGRRFTGALRLTQAEASKAIFFEQGAPVFATSNLPHEQIEEKLFDDGLLTEELLNLKRERNLDAHRLGLTLVDMNVLSEVDWRRAVRELIEQIVESLFEWSEADYIFEEAALPPHATRIEWTAADCVLRGARRAALANANADAIASPDTLVAPVAESLDFVHTAPLNPTEGYVLSCIQAPTRVAQVSTLTGLAEEEVRRALAVLLPLGALRLLGTQTIAKPCAVDAGTGSPPPVAPADLAPVPGTEPPGGTEPVVADGGERSGERNGIDDGVIYLPSTTPTDEEDDAFAFEPPEAFDDDEAWDFDPEETTDDAGGEAAPPEAAPPEASEQDIEAEWLLTEVRGKLMQLEIASYYEVLGVDRFATTAAIRQAYYNLEQMFEPYQARWPAGHELNLKLTELLALISQAFFTLSDPNRRRDYDMPAGQRAAEQERRRTAPAAPVKRVSPPPIVKGALPLPPVKSLPLPPPVKPTPPAKSAPAASARAAVMPVARPPAAAPPALLLDTPVKIAAEKFRQGRARYEQRDFHSAVHLLREAAKLDPSRAEHHYLLAVTLSVLSQARHMHEDHEGCHVTCKLGGALIRNQRIRYEAVQHFREAAQLDRQNAKIRVQLGMLYKEAGMHKKAEACFWEALLIDGKNETAMQELGLNGQVEVLKSENPLAQKAAKGRRKKKK